MTREIRMKYSVNLFGYKLECDLRVDNGLLFIDCSEEKQVFLKNYLLRVLPKYNVEVSPDDPFEDLVRSAIEAEKMLKGHLSEPTTKLPYDLKPEIKDMLVEIAEANDTSATQQLIRIIENKYNQTVLS